MKKGLIYFLGIITGVILTFIVFFAIGMASSSSNDNIEYFSEEQIHPFGIQDYEVFQVLSDGSALAHGLSGSIRTLTTVLLLPEDDLHFYDTQKISAPKGKEFVQIGTFRYKSKDGLLNTIPAVTLR